MPMEIDRYFMSISPEPVLGIMTSTDVILGQTTQLGEADRENVAKSFATAMIEVSGKFCKPWKGLVKNCWHVFTQLR